MRKKSHTRSAFFKLRALISLLFCFAGALLALFASGAFTGRIAERPARYAPVPGSRLESESANLGRLEQFWNDRLTYPTGRFDPGWLRAAAVQHTRLPIGVPAGAAAVLNALSPLAF